MKKILLFSLLGLLIIGTGLYFLYPQPWLAFSVKNRFSLKKEPLVYLPLEQRQLTQNSKFNDNYPEYSCSGIKFKTPWKDIVENKQTAAYIKLKFLGDKSLSIICVTQEKENYANQLLEAVKEEQLKYIKGNAESFWGKDLLGSNYLFYKTILESNPNQISFFTPRREAVKKYLLVILKAVSAFGKDIIYNFENKNGIRGFQFGNPESIEGNRLTIDFFDNKDTKYTMIVSGTQEEIDFILSSITSEQPLDITQSSNTTLPTTCIDQPSGADTAVPVITSLSSYVGSVGTQLEIRGCNFAGFEGDKNAWIENSKGIKGVLYGKEGSTNKLMMVSLESPLCQHDNSYSGLPCGASLDLTPGVYKIYTMPWGKKSNEVMFTIR